MLSSLVLFLGILLILLGLLHLPDLVPVVYDDSDEREEGEQESVHACREYLVFFEESARAPGRRDQYNAFPEREVVALDGDAEVLPPAEIECVSHLDWVHDESVGERERYAFRIDRGSLGLCYFDEIQITEVLFDKLEGEIAFELVCHVLVKDKEPRQLLFLADKTFADGVPVQAAVDPADAHSLHLVLAGLLAELGCIHLVVPDVLVRGV